MEKQKTEIFGQSSIYIIEITHQPWHQITLWPVIQFDFVFYCVL